MQGTAKDTDTVATERENRWTFLTRRMSATGTKHLSKKRLEDIQAQYAMQCSYVADPCLFISAAPDCTFRPSGGALAHLLTLANDGNISRLHSMKEYWTQLDLSSLEQMQQQQQEEEDQQQQQLQEDGQQQQAEQQADQQQQQQAEQDGEQGEPQQGQHGAQQQQQQQPPRGDPVVMFDMESRGPAEEAQKRRRQDADGNQQKRRKGDAAGDDSDDDSDMDDTVRAMIQHQSICTFVITYIAYSA